MSNWFETVVPDDHTWSNISPTNEKISSKDALDIVGYLNSVLSDPMNPKFDNDNFTAIVNIKNGFIPINGDYTASRSRSRARLLENRSTRPFFTLTIRPLRSGCGA